MGGLTLIDVSLVSIDDALIRRVAERCTTDEARVRQYLASDAQDDSLLRAFLFFGVGPINKTFTTVQPVGGSALSMGCAVPHRG